MAKHRRQTTSATKRGLTAASAVIAGATLVAPTAANAAEVRVPNSAFAADVPGVENIPGLANVPGIEAWVPSLAGKATPNANVNAAIQAAKANAGLNAIPGFNQWIAGVEAKYAGAPAQYRGAAQAAAPAPVQPQGQRILEIAKSKVCLLYTSPSPRDS